MWEKLAKIARRYEEVTAMLSDPGTYGDLEKMRDLSREQKELQEVAEVYETYLATQSTMEEAKALLSDPEMGEFAREEMARAKTALAELEERCRILLLPKDPDDRKNVVLEIRAGTGGEEAALFAGELLRMYRMYAQKRGFAFSVAYASETELGGVKEAVVTVEGEGVWSRLKFEAGTHCIKRVPETEAAGRIHTSTATVAVMPEAEEREVEIDPKDLRIDTYHSSGAGGQHENKTESAIRITHLPTGMVVECQDERSQLSNKNRAMTILRTRLNEAEREKQDSEYAQRRRMQIGGAERSERIRTYRFQEKIVVDHRLEGENKTVSVTTFLDGDLDDVIDALTLQEQARRLQNND